MATRVDIQPHLFHAGLGVFMQSDTMPPCHIIHTMEVIQRHSIQFICLYTIMKGDMMGEEPRDGPESSVEGVRGETHVERETAKKDINYAHVRTNWTTYPLHGSFECVMVSKSQVLGGSLTVPRQRAERILGVSDANIPRVSRADTSQRLVRVEEPFKNHVVVQRVNMDACAVIWDATCTRGYLVKLKHYKSQPTQVFLHGLHACFEELKVEPWSVLCFVPTGVVGHCQLFVWPADHPHYQGFQSCTVHQWSFMKSSSERDTVGDEDTSAEQHPLPEPGVLAIETAQGGDGRTNAVVVKDHFLSLSTEDISIVSPAPYPKKWMDSSGKMGRSKKGPDSSSQKRQSSVGSAKDRSISTMQKHRRARNQIKEDSENTGGRNRGLVQGSQATGSKNTCAPLQHSDSNIQSLTGKNGPSDAHRTNLRRRMRKARPVQSNTV